MPRPSAQRPTLADGIRRGVLDDLVGYGLRRAQHAMQRDFEGTLDAFDLTPQRFEAMVLVGANPGITQRDLGEGLGIARSGVVQVAHQLVARDWLLREPDADDARAWRLRLTAAGGQHLVAARRGVRAHDRRIGRMLGERDRKTLIALLARLVPDR